MNDYVVYILWSDKHQKMYTGYTNNLIGRFNSHNNLATKGWTIRYRPWRVVFVKFHKTKKTAMEFEKFLKSGVGREWIEKNVVFK